MKCRNCRNHCFVVVDLWVKIYDNKKHKGLADWVRVTAIPETNSPPSEACPDTHDFMFMV